MVFWHLPIKLHIPQCHFILEKPNCINIVFLFLEKILSKRTACKRNITVCIAKTSTSNRSIRHKRWDTFEISSCYFQWHIKILKQENLMLSLLKWFLEDFSLRFQQSPVVGSWNDSVFSSVLFRAFSWSTRVNLTLSSLRKCPVNLNSWYRRKIKRLMQNLSSACPRGRTSG